MGKKFLLDLPEAEHQSLKLAAVQAGISMHTFIRDAIGEKIRRGRAAFPLVAPDTDDSEAAVLAEVKDKPA